MERLYQNHNLKLVDHFAQDGLAPQLSEKFDNWDEAQFNIWCDYHYSICREASILGATNHAMVIGQK